MQAINFTVDSRLLAELGERLVGKPHIALAELVKNSYDADATEVVIKFREDRIEVTDNGHGMDFDSFKDFWMRIGTTHKQNDRVSRRLKRPLTGSKGVGRLAVQFLARKLGIYTASQDCPNRELRATVDWAKAVSAGDLTEATADYETAALTTAYPGGTNHGTRIILTGLNQEWDAKAIEGLAREIWRLQPPFRSNPELTSDRQRAFEVRLESEQEEEVRKFQAQMSAILDLWEARLAGKLVTGDGRDQSKKVRLSLEFSDQTRLTREYSVPNCKVQAAEFEIRVFHLQHRQAHGIRVEDAREYLKIFGGVHVYDAGFHLPYYGADTDWLGIEMDHSHRLSRSRLLPERLQVSGGMSFLPTNSRLYGVVHVDTSRERQLSRRDREHLNIQVTRDRLVDNESFQGLQKLVRYALDFYAMEESKRALQRAEIAKGIAEQTFTRVEDVLEAHRSEIAPPVYAVLRKHVKEAIRATEAEKTATIQHVGLLGALATAGISAVAYEHESSKQLLVLEDIAAQMKDMRLPGGAAARVGELAQRLLSWVQRARSMRALFSHVMDEEDRQRRARYKAGLVIEQIKTQMVVLTREIDIQTAEIDPALMLPEGTFAEWSAVFQNVFINAVNATLDSPVKVIAVSSSVRGRTRALLVQDTGSGVALSSSEELFDPFVRKLEISQERKSLGLGGTGLGLTIVRMVATSLNCRVSFTQASAGFNTAFQLSWSEEE
ncbi:MAG TPA: ATP-binding protein [Candidatus Sulfotelmatobacter sp.]|nr:ATP-binding protein [Candidatus Sulfotelmatobacter sp.]